MMKRSFLTACISVAVAGLATATDLNLNVKSGSSNTVIIAPGETFSYTVTGELTDNASLGLGTVIFDLTYTGGVLDPAATPTADPMARFANPQGLNNPAGFGGTPHNGVLLQVGGAQNTINNTVAPVPNGAVLTNVAQMGSPVVLAQGTVRAGYRCSVYSLAATNLFANVIRQGETGTPFWHVDPCGAGANTSLTVRVNAIRPSVLVVSASAHQRQVLRLNAGLNNAGRQYLLLGSLSGTSPGTTFMGVHVPLNPDSYFNFTVNNPNSSILPGSMGTLDATGRASAAFLPDNTFVNQTANHAFLLINPSSFVSEPESCQVIP
jgi:hypothetical protein